MMSFLFYTTIAMFIFVCLFMILLILIQKGRGGGLASAFGGAGGNTAFGSKTGDVLTWATSVVFGVFLLLAVALNLFADARNRAGQQAKVTPLASEKTAPIEVPLRSESAPATQAAVPRVETPSTGPSTVPGAAAPAPTTTSTTTGASAATGTSGKQGPASATPQAAAPASTTPAPTQPTQAPPAPTNPSTGK